MTNTALPPDLRAAAAAYVYAKRREQEQEQGRIWRRIARPEQIAPDWPWVVWLILTGRGWGKTRTGAEWVGEVHERVGRIALVGQDAADVRDVMVEGESGILACSPRHDRPHYEPSKRRLTWPNGAIATTYSGDDPDALRGPQHGAAWVDELAKFRHAQECWDNLMLGLRLGDDPRCVVTTTPRPTKLIKELAGRDSTHVTRGHTYENLDNLAPTFREQIIERYEGTRLGRQELAGEIVEDVEGALWEWAWIDDHRVSEAPALRRVVVAVDPGGSGEDADYTGIAVVGRGAEPCDACRQRGWPSDYYVLASHGYHLSPHGWASRALDLYEQHQADRIIAEKNHGGDMVESTIRQVNKSAPLSVISASRGKEVRAEPVAALYQQGRVHHVGTFGALEEQQTTFPVAHEHDDELDAVVYAVSDLMKQGGANVRWIG